ncbi:MAG TPA: hypothetical protein VFH99_03665 [Candidatus Saccharimonadales bacterium]|nr:hypothetical protein [Candidatus Saccharimonadales bacterium]
MFGHDDHDNHDSHDENHKPDDNSWQHPGPPPADDDSHSTDNSGDDSPDETSDSPKTDDTSPTPPGFSLGSSQSHHDHHADTVDFAATPTVSGSDGGAGDDLIDLKQEALTKLSPLVGHLDQTPDEKFRTLMMMIQASDDQKLVRQAYDTALKIDDEKERAQALLDIVNEINYFTQNPGSSTD